MKGVYIMEVVRKFIDGNKLMSVISLPENFRNHKLEVIIMPTEEETKTEADGARIDSAIRKLTGAVPYTDMSLSELREERLRKYEITD
jgi:hypothetical protein